MIFDDVYIEKFCIIIIIKLFKVLRENKARDTCQEKI